MNGFLSLEIKLWLDRSTEKPRFGTQTLDSAITLSKDTKWKSFVSHSILMACSLPQGPWTIRPNYGMSKLDKKYSIWKDIEQKSSRCILIQMVTNWWLHRLITRQKYGMFALVNAYIPWKAILQSSHAVNLTSQAIIASRVALTEQPGCGTWVQANASKLSEVTTTRF